MIHSFYYRHALQTNNVYIYVTETIKDGNYKKLNLEYPTDETIFFISISCIGSNHLWNIANKNLISFFFPAFEEDLIFHGNKTFDLS